MKALIAAVDDEFGIGRNGLIPWYVPEDFKWFKKHTQKSICIMGYNTFKELADKFDYHNTGKLLPNRMCCIITSKSIPISLNIQSFKSIDECLKYFENDERNKFFIGGVGIFKEALHLVDRVYLTCISGKYNCDTFFPIDALEFQKIKLNLVQSSEKCNFYIGNRE